MNYKNYKEYIIVDDDNRPMAFAKPQLVYCQNDKQRKPFPVKVYDLFHAREYIRISQEYAKSQGMTPMNYYLMPVKY